MLGRNLNGQNSGLKMIRSGSNNKHKKKKSTHVFIF